MAPSPGPARWVRWEPHGAHQLFHQCAGTPTPTALPLLEGRAEEKKVKPHSPKLSSAEASTSPKLLLPTVWHLQLTFGWLRDRLSSHSPHQSRAAEVGACPHPLPRLSLPALGSASAPAITSRDRARGWAPSQQLHTWH